MKPNEKKAIRSEVAGLVFVHNHPSGDPTPSREDIAITNTLKRAACLIGINLLDHIVITETDFVSFVNKKIL